jgi:hypothetical protein
VKTTTNDLTYLVGGFNHLENMKVNGKDYPIHFGKIKNAPNHQPDYLHYMI